MRHVLYINDTPSSDYGVYISSDTYLNAPKIDYTAYQVPARSGDLVQFNKRLKNVVRHFTCFIPKNVDANLDGFKKLLYSNIGYLKIASDYDNYNVAANEQIYQYGYLAEEMTATPFRTGDALQATFELYFSCNPKKYSRYEWTGYKTSDNTYWFEYASIKHRSELGYILDELPSGVVPDDEFFFYFDASGAQFFYNKYYTAYWSGGNTFMALYDGNAKSVLGYTLTSFQNLPFTMDDGEEGDAPNLRLITPVKATGAYTLTVVDEWTYTTGTIEDHGFGFGQASFIGADVTIRGRFFSAFDNLAPTVEDIIVTSHQTIDGDPTGCVVIHFDHNLPQDLLDFLGAYAYQSSTSPSAYANYLNISIDLSTMSAYAKATDRGLPDYPMNDYFSIGGELGEGAFFRAVMIYGWFPYDFPTAIERRTDGYATVWKL